MNYIPRPLPQSPDELNKLILGALAFAKYDINDRDATIMICNNLMQLDVGVNQVSVAHLGRQLTRFRANQRAWEVLEYHRLDKKQAQAAQAALEAQKAAALVEKVDSSPVSVPTE